MIWTSALAALALLLSTRVVVAETRLHALAIGNNRAFVAAGKGRAAFAPEASPLRYADDDAAAFLEFVLPVARSAELLTVMDDDTQRLYPRLVFRAQVPTIGAVRSAVGRIARQIEGERAAGHRSVVLVFFSGHGAVNHDGTPALALFDGGLSHDFLYREVLERLPANELHLFIDACHAEAVVRPREAQAEIVSVSPGDANRFLVRSTLARFPQVGAIVAATTNAKAHEWDVIRHGVFTHELLSALRGAADINRDRRIEYSEVYAFMAAANREVRDVRAQLAIVAKPPETNRRAVLLELSRFPREGLAWLAGVPGQFGMIELGDARGRRLATLHGDYEFDADLLVPADSILYLRAGQREARFRVGSGEVTEFQRLAFTEVESRERDALDDAFRRGLFAAPYGRRYYDGVVDQIPTLLPVDFPERDDVAERRYWSTKKPKARNYKLVLGGGLSSGIAQNVPVLQGANFGVRPGSSNGPALSLEVLGADDGLLHEWRMMGSGGWLWSIGSGKFRGWGGGMIGGGLLLQQLEGSPNRRSAAGALGPVLGFSTEVSEPFGLWSELGLSALLHQRDEEAAVTFVPTAWLGASLGL